MSDLAGTGAFASYVELSKTTQTLAPEFIKRVAFTDSMKTKVVKTLAPVLAGLEKATREQCDYPDRIQGAFDVDPDSPEWRLIGHALAWRIASAVEAEDWANAVSWTIVATKFGFDLTQGDAQSATLGFAIVSDARKALAPALERMPSQNLASLSQGIVNALSRFKGLAGTVEHEKTRMLYGVQFIQDCRKNKNYALIDDELGRTVSQATTYLRDMDEKHRPEYFEGFAREASAYADHWKTEVEKPRPERKAWEEPSGNRPWKRFSKAFCSSIEPLLDISDAAITKTRLLAINAWALSRSKSTGQAPANLDGFKPIVKTDPFSGQAFIYSASGSDFKVYSVGEDGKDDGGDADGTSTGQDIVLESGSD